MSETELLHNLRTARLIKEPRDGIWVEYQHVQGKPFVTVDWATVQAAIKELDEQIARLQSIVRARNAHDDLLKACENIFGIVLSSDVDVHNSVAASVFGGWEDAVDKLELAIQVARETES